MNLPKRLIVMFAFAVTSIATSTSNAQFEEAARWVPESANTIVMIRGKEILESDFAKKNKWRRKGLTFDAGISFGPGKTERVLMASQIDFEFMEPIWSVCVFEEHGTVDLIDISKQTGGILDELNGEQAIRLPSDAFLVSLGNSSLGSFYPANRQAAARWNREHKNSGMKLSPYLKQAVKFADANADIIMAFDFSDVAHPKLVHDHLAEICDADKMDAVCEDICSVSGATLGITINDKITGALKIDFNDSTASFSESGKKFLIEILRNNGMMIDDLQSWTYQASPTQIQLKGSLSTNGLRNITGIVHHPMLDDYSTGYSPGAAEVDAKTSSLQYFHDLERLTKTLSEKSSKSLASNAVWYDRYARRIDEISSVGVDPDLLSYGQFVANSFRNVSGVLRSANLSKVLSRGAYNELPSYGDSSRYGYGGDGYYNSYGSRNLRTRHYNIVDAQERLEGFNSANEIVQEVNAQTAEIRQAMSKKYEINF